MFGKDIIINFKTNLKNNEINRNIFINTLGAFLVKGGALIISLFTMPAYMRYFGEQQILGLWFTIISALSWILTFDLGIGNGLRNHLVPVLVNNHQDKAKKLISSAYIMTISITLTSITLAIIIFRYINWNSFFNISINVISKETLNMTVLIIFSGIMIQFLLKLITSILYAMQKSAAVNFLRLVTSVITFIYVLNASTSYISTNLISLAVVHVLAVNAPLLVATIYIFSKDLKGYKPEIRYFEVNYAKKVMKLGGIFFWIQIMYMLITATNEFFITWLTTPRMVVEYQIYYKLFTLIGTLFMLTLTPIWSAVTRASSQNNFIWIKKLFSFLKVLAAIAITLQFLMIPFLQIVIDLWLGDNAIKVNYVTAFIFAISGSILIWNGVLSSIANGLGELKTQLIFFTLGAILKIPIAWILVNLLDSWIGVIISNIVAMSLYCIIQPIWLNRTLTKKESEGNLNV